MKLWRIMLCLLLVVVVFGGTIMAADRFAKPAQMDAQDKIDRVLYTHQALDAVVMEDEFLAESFRQSGANVVLYYSETAQTRFTFDKDTGKLLASVRVDTGKDLQNDTENTKQMLSAEEMRNAAILLAEKELGEAVFGKLQIVEESQQGRSCYYTISDYYEGIPTGTNIFLGVDEYGEKILSAPQKGSIFVRKTDGTVEMANQEPLIKEEEARKIALDAALQKVKQAGREESAEIVSCEVRAAVNTLYYWLEAISPLDDKIDISYLIAVDVYSGKVISILSSD